MVYIFTDLLLGMARKVLTNLSVLIWNKKEMLSILTHREHSFVTKHIKVYLQDIVDHVLKQEERVRITRELVENLNATWLTRLSIGKQNLDTLTNQNWPKLLIL